MASFVFEQIVPKEEESQSWTCEDLEIDLSPLYCRKPASDDPDDKRIESLWQAKREKNPTAKLLNALKFRLAETHRVLVSKKEEQEQEEGEGTKEKSKLKLCLGITDYKSHVGTNSALDPELKFENDSELAHALGVEACVITKEKNNERKLVMFQRSKFVADFAGYYSFAGGHSEPYRLFRKVEEELLKSRGESEKEKEGEEEKSSLLSSSLFDPKSERIDEKIPENLIVSECEKLVTCCKKLLLDEQRDNENNYSLSQLIAQEIFHSIKDEVACELGVPAELVSVNRILGVVRATCPKTQRGKPDLLFAAEINASFEEVKKVFLERKGEDAFEAVDESLLGWSISQQDPKLEKLFSTIQNITPASRAAAELAVQSGFI